MHLFHKIFRLFLRRPVYATVPVLGNRHPNHFVQKSFIPVFIAAVILVAIPAQVSAAYTFTHNLSQKGNQSSAEVTVLQRFLTDTGVYTGPITGYFGPLTYKGVVAFQKQQGITPTSGYFGPLSRASANALIAEADKQATVAALSVSGTTSAATGSASITDSLSASAYKGYSFWFKPKPKPTTTPAPTPTTTPSTPPVATSTPTTTPSTPPATSSGVAWGAYNGYTLASLTSIENTVGKPANIQAIFWGWDDTFPTTFNSLGAGKTLVIFWEPSFNFDAINDGSKDAYIAAFAKGAKTYAATHPLILVPFDEPNLAEEIWGDTGSNTPAKFVAAWKRIHDIFVANGATNVKFAIAYNNESTGTHKNFSDYYPGSAYVDYVGVDGFNFGNPWMSPSQVFASSIATISTFGKPIYIFSTASAAGSQKAAWITSFGSYVKTIPNIQGWVWFNENKEQNWLVNSDAASLAAFKGII